MDLTIFYLMTFCLVQNTLAQGGDYGQIDYNAILAAQVAKNRAVIAGTLAKQYGSKAKAEGTIADDLARKSREKAALAKLYTIRAKKLEGKAKEEEDAVVEARKQAELLVENATQLKKQATEVELKGKGKDKSAMDYRKKARDQEKQAHALELIAKQAQAEAEGFEELAMNTNKFIAELKKPMDYLGNIIRDLRKKSRDCMNKAQYQRSLAASNFEKASVLKKNAQEYNRVATETDLISKETLNAALGLHILAEEEKSKIKVEEVKSKYDTYIAQLFRSQANDNKHFAEHQLRDSKFYGSRAKLAKARALVFEKTALEAQQTALTAVKEQKKVGDLKADSKDNKPE